MAQTLNKTNQEFWLTRAQFNARKESDSLVVGAIYHITDEKYQLEITATNKLNADLLSEGTTNKLVSASDKTNWNAKVDDVKIKDTSIVSNGIATIPSATQGVLGVVQTNSHYGIITNPSGLIYTNLATNDDIDAKTNVYKPIVPSNLVYATKVGMLGNTSLTATEKATIRTNIGAVTSSDIPTDYVDISSTQTITGQKTTTQKLLYQGSATRLPDGYRQAEYIDVNSGQPYFDTLINPQNKPRVIMYMAFTNSGDVDYFGNNSIDGSCFFANFSQYSLMYYRYAKTGSLGTGVTAALQTFHEWSIGDTVLLDGNLMYTVPSANVYVYNANQSTIRIFNSARNHPSNFKLGWFKLYDGDNLVRDYVPCKRESDNAIGLYDFVSETFFVNANSSGVFSLGKLIDTVQYLTETDVSNVAISGSYNDLGDKPNIPIALSDLTSDATHRLVTDTEKTIWNKADTAIQPDDDISKLNNDVGYTTNTGTVTSVGITNGGGLSVSNSPITTSGNITITNTGVRSITQDSTDGNKLIINTNGTEKTITIPGGGSSTNTAHTHSVGDGLIKTGDGGVTGDVKYEVNTSYITTGKNYKVQVDSISGGLYVNVPWENTDTNTHRPIQINGDEILGNNTTPFGLTAGTNVSLSNSGGTVTINATDTTYTGSTTIGKKVTVNNTNHTIELTDTYAGGTVVTLNNVSKASSSASFYAPTSGGTSGYELIGNGTTSEPVWRQPTGYLSCTTSASTYSKTASCSNFKLVTGVVVNIKFTYAHTSTSGAYLNVNSTGSKVLQWLSNGNAITSSNSWSAGDVVQCIYDGMNWKCINLSKPGISASYDSATETLILG